MSLEQKPNAFQARPEPGLEEPIPLQSVQVPLSIQFGPTIRSFNELPVTIGTSPNCDFTLNHPAILDRHAQIFFSQGEYWVKDLTGQNLVSINGKPVHLKAPLIPDSHLLLSPGGPQFRFLGGGRLAEIEESVREESMVSPAEKAERSPQSVKKRKSLLDKFFRS
jgi:pSer/pThr/pTyr-binding forkhead associated (FHA) protein